MNERLTFEEAGKLAPALVDWIDELQRELIILRAKCTELQQWKDAESNTPRWLPDMGVRFSCGYMELTTAGNVIRIDNGDTANAFELPDGFALCTLVDSSDPYLRRNATAGVS